MTNKNYQRGAAFERRVRDMIRNAGGYAERTAGSHGVADVIASINGVWLLIQCKTGKARMTTDNRYDLYYTAQEVGAVALLAQPERGGVRLSQLFRLNGDIALDDMFSLVKKQQGGDA